MRSRSDAGPRPEAWPSATLARLAACLPPSFRSLAERFIQGPIDTIEELARFVQTRSAYVAQTSLFGYLKTRMGTKFRVYFEDEVFSETIRVAAIKVFASCLADLSVFAAAAAAQDRLDAKQTADLARHFFAAGLDHALAERDLVHVPKETLAAFDQRLQQTLWAEAIEGGQAFTGSALDLVRHAPVIDAFKDLDREIVRNSIRFRWRDVREQLNRRLDREKICGDWRGRFAAIAPSRQ